MAAHPNVIAALSAAVQAEPNDVPLRLHLATLLLESEDPAAALEQFTAVLTRDPAHREALNGAARAAEGAGDRSRAEGYRRLCVALGGPTGGRDVALPVCQDRAGTPPEERSDADREELDWNRLMGRPGERSRVAIESEGMPDSGEWEVERPGLKLADVGGMEAVKRRLNTAFLAPLRSPDLMRMYGKSLRGGLLMYGPPGCGKTFIARALAGELGARFISVGLADVWFRRRSV